MGEGRAAPRCHVNKPNKTSERSARARTRGQNPLVCERFIYSQDRSTYFQQQNRQIDLGNTV
jgi:hypothetical protein